MLQVNNTTIKVKGGIERGGGGGGGPIGGGLKGKFKGHCSQWKLVSRVYSYFNMAAAGTAVCRQTKAIYFELETHMSKSWSVWIL